MALDVRSKKASHTFPRWITVYDGTVGLTTDHISGSLAVKSAILDDLELVTAIEDLGTCALGVLLGGGKVIFAGNGGSFADSQHLAAEFVSKLLSDRVPLPAVALGTNSSSMSAIGNDYGFEQVFARELRAIASETDLFIPISTSGNSENIVHAVRAANEIGTAVVALTGGTGGRLKDVCNCIRVPSTNTAHIQEAHIMIGHIVCAIAEKPHL